MWLKNKYKKYLCLKEIVVHAQNMTIIQCSIVNIVEETHMIIQ